jgi:hypothetical protein
MSENKKRCDIPHCEMECVPTRLFYDTTCNITCIRCKHFMCNGCTTRIWKGEWNGEQFYKHKSILPNMEHGVFMCPFCRSSFDRMDSV